MTNMSPEVTEYVLIRDVPEETNQPSDWDGRRCLLAVSDRSG